MGPCFGQEGNFPLLSSHREAGLGPLPAPRPSPGPAQAQAARLIDWKFMGLRNRVTDDVERSQPPTHFHPESPPHLGNPRQFSEPSKPGEKERDSYSSSQSPGLGPGAGRSPQVFTELRVSDPPCCQDLMFLTPRMRAWTGPAWKSMREGHRLPSLEILLPHPSLFEGLG